MSHVTKIELHVTDLEALKAAAEALGLEFRVGQKTYRWYGRFVGDAPMPEGFTANDLGKCEHAIGVKGDEQVYEVGIVARRDGKPGYTLMWDYWCGGFGLMEKIGQDGGKLRQGYAEQVAIKSLRRQGFRFQRTVKPDGSVQIVAQK